MNADAEVVIEILTNKIGELSKDLAIAQAVVAAMSQKLSETDQTENSSVVPESE